MSAREFAPEELEIRGARRYVAETPLAQYDGDQALGFVSKKYGVPIREIMGRSRTKTITRARHELFRMLREIGWSLPDIGRFCDRDHTTVMVALRKFPKMAPLALYKRALDSR